MLKPSPPKTGLNPATSRTRGVMCGWPVAEYSVAEDGSNSDVSMLLEAESFTDRTLLSLSRRTPGAPKAEPSEARGVRDGVPGPRLDG